MDTAGRLSHGYSGANLVSSNGVTLLKTVRVASKSRANFTSKMRAAPPPFRRTAAAGVQGRALENSRAGRLGSLSPHRRRENPRAA